MFSTWSQSPLLFGLIITILSTAVIFVFSIAHNNSSIYDPYWVIAPPFLVVLLKSCADSGLYNWDYRSLIILLLFLIWASRYHVFYAWSGWRTGLAHEDWRYEEMRSAPLPYWLNSLLGMHYFPTLLVYVAFIPAATVLSSTAAPSALNFYDFLGVLIALSAVLIQYFADKQLKIYRTTDAYARGETCREGLWNYSRHPNYFGEVLFWLSTILFTLGAQLFEGQAIFILFGPFSMAIFFRFSSYLMDVRSLKKRPNYQKAVQEISAMVPWFPKKKMD
jgi:steroid 5-alpha reductase family enzyme